MKLFDSTKNKIIKGKNGENVPYVDIIEVVLVHCNIANNEYQQDSRVSYTFVRNKSGGSLWKSAPTNFIPLEAFNSDFLYI